ncbi:MAG: BREX-1 system adenine-specific DNA-methyltransferase PglX [Nanoarchaeota archaeon]|nr:BREX-1 system adenine-specific DNA-methyltransferase PglX [Nanoarchaeota archaeon]
MKTLAEGFINWAESNLTKTEEDLKVIQENTMKFLYRLLFIFFAEAKGLLDISQKTSASKNYAEHYSLDSLKKKIKNKIKSGEDIPAYLDSYYNQLQTLFNFIDNGTEVSGIPKEKLYIPSYNGGLFDAEKNKFLSEKKIGDHYLARAIDLLASTEGKKPEEKGFIDYSSLDIRHLGSIYEGLLEYKLKLATEPMVAVKEKGKEKWVPESEFKGKKSIERVDANEIYLATDKGGRKATGSYYTPEYIVKYIVENTLTPIVKEKIDKAIENNNKCSDAILSIKVLDPAMGSGHFLVEAVDFLGQRLGDAINSDIKRGLLKEGDYSDDWLRREIVSNCIYGVDLNLMAVELAKVSLWLKTISKDKPLSFLDHRLKCGNSLIGAHLIDLPWHPSKKRDETQRRLDVPEGFIKKLVETIEQLSAISDDTLEDIKKKEEIFTQVKNTMEYDMIKTLADVRTSIYFGNKVDEKTYGSYTGDAFHSSRTEWKERREKWFAQKGRENAENKHFFHWELEFPEIFFEEGKPKENPGFDAVVGNPPYIRDRLQQEVTENNFFSIEFRSAYQKYDIYALFVEKGIYLLKSGGDLGFIMPNKFMAARYAIPLREILLKDTCMKHIVDVSQIGVFPNISVYPHIIVLEKRSEKIENKNKIEFSFVSDVKSNSMIFSDLKQIDQSIFSQIPDKMIISSMDSVIENITTKIKNMSVQLGELCNINEGVHTGNLRDKLLVETKVDDKSHPAYTGENFGRYESVWGGKFIRYDWSIIKNEPNGYGSLREEKIFTTPEKIICREIHTRISCTYDNEQKYFLNHLYSITPKIHFQEGLLYITSLLNSKTLSFFFDSMFMHAHISGGYRQYKAFYLDRLPIRLIHFTTPAAERARLVEEAKKLYAAPDFAELLKLTDDCLPKDANGNFIAEKEKSDVVHDSLTYLAEQMIEMNKEKNRVVKDFLEWIQSEIKTKPETLTGRTKLKQYYILDFDELLTILKNNKKRIPVNISSLQFHKNLKEGFETSKNVLTPLRIKIEATDNLIDQIVYKLYGLTEEEIKIVEESIGKK